MDYRSAVAHYSRTIETARVICILTMSYVHLHFFELPETATVFAFADAVVVDLLGRSSVPLLTTISGFLIVGSLAKGFALLLRAKVRTILVPMIAWNVVAVLLLGTTKPLWDDILALTSNPRLIYLGFLRDLLVLILLSPALVWCVQRAPTVSAVVALTFHIVSPDTGVILRPQMVGFFVAGIYAALYAHRLRPPARRERGAVVVAVVAVMVLQLLALTSPAVADIVHDRLYDDLVRRPTMAAAMLVLCLSISGTAFSRWVLSLRHATFTFFLSHGIAFIVVGSIYSRVPAAHTPTIYLLLWLLTPLAVFTVLAAAQRLIRPETGVQREGRSPPPTE